MMNVYFRKEECEDQLKIKEHMTRIISNQNGISYDYEIYDIFIEVLGVERYCGILINYQVPKSNYIDIFILPKYRRYGYGKLSINEFIKQKLNNGDTYIRANDKRKNIFLKSIGFEHVEGNLYNNLYVKRSINK